MKKKLVSLIAKTIKDTDDSYFFENYTTQATAILKALRDNGYIILPRELDEETIQAGVDNMPYGRLNPKAMVTGIYKAIADTYSKKPSQ